MKEFNEHEKLNHSRHINSNTVGKVSNADSLQATNIVKCGKGEKSPRSNNEVRSHNMNIHYYNMYNLMCF